MALWQREKMQRAIGIVCIGISIESTRSSTQSSSVSHPLSLFFLLIPIFVFHRTATP
jgi:hypothetical protein